VVFGLESAGGAVVLEHDFVLLLQLLLEETHGVSLLERRG
jgi:hypothetical protein